MTDQTNSSPSKFQSSVRCFKNPEQALSEVPYLLHFYHLVPWWSQEQDKLLLVSRMQVSPSPLF